MCSYEFSPFPVRQVGGFFAEKGMAQGGPRYKHYLFSETKLFWKEWFCKCFLTLFTPWLYVITQGFLFCMETLLVESLPPRFLACFVLGIVRVETNYSTVDHFIKAAIWNEVYPCLKGYGFKERKLYGGWVFPCSASYTSVLDGIW